MRERNRLDFLLPRNPRQKLVAQFPRGHFQGQFRFRGKRLHVRAFDGHPQLHRGGGFADEPLVRVAGTSAQPVVEVRDGNVPAIPWGERMENAQQNHRIRAAGNSDEDFPPAQKQAAVLNFAFDPLEEFAHAFILLFLGAAGKRRDYCASLSR